MTGADLAVKEPLASRKRTWHFYAMPKARKAKRDNGVVMYIRVTPEMHEQIAKAAKRRASRRGYPHPMTSVAVELIAQGLQAEAQNEEHP